MTFHATIQLAGKTATGIEIPADLITALASGKCPPVRVTINGYTYRSTIAVRAGRYLVGISSAVRAAAGREAGAATPDGLSPSRAHLRARVTSSSAPTAISTSGQ